MVKLLWAIAILVDLLSCVKVCCHSLTDLFVILRGGGQRAGSNIRVSDAVSLGGYIKKFSVLIGPLDAERGPTIRPKNKYVRQTEFGGPEVRGRPATKLTACYSLTRVNHRMH